MEGSLGEALSNLGQAGAAQTVPPSDKEKKLREAGAAGVDTKSQVGQWWAKAVAKDAELLARYQSVGKGFAAQRAFRSGWAREQAAEMEATRTLTQRSIEVDESNGTYEALTVIAQKEGGGAEGATAAKNYADKCISLMRQGVTWKGRELIQWNDWTKRYELAYIKRQFRSCFEQQWDKQVVMTGLSDKALAGVDSAVWIPIGTAIVDRRLPGRGRRRRRIGKWSWHRSWRRYAHRGA